MLDSLFKALGDKNRLRIINMLEHKPLCVCEITAILNLAVSTVSSHLKILKNANLIIEKKNGKWVNYELNTKADQAILELLDFVKKHAIAAEFIADQAKAQNVNRENLCCK